MVLPCAACGAQNFISRERLSAVPPPPRCWRCGAVLAVGETPPGGTESNRKAVREGTGGEETDA